VLTLITGGSTTLAARSMEPHTIRIYAHRQFIIIKKEKKISNSTVAAIFIHINGQQGTVD
jgi:hypothetical protein